MPPCRKEKSRPIQIIITAISVDACAWCVCLCGLGAVICRRSPRISVTRLSVSEGSVSLTSERGFYNVILFANIQ